MNMRVSAAQLVCRAIASGFTHADQLAGDRAHYERCRQDAMAGRDFNPGQAQFDQHAMAAALTGFMQGRALRDCCGND
jgi:hypothetical protein